MTSSIKLGLLKVLLTLLFLYAHGNTLAWLGEKSLHGADSFLVVFGICGFVFVCVAATLIDWGVAANRAAVILLCFAVIGALLNRITIDFPQFHVFFLILGAYGFAGISRYVGVFWMRLLALVVLCAASLPFYLEFSSGLGFGVRLLTADIVENILKTIGFSAISSHDVILTENSILHVDIPCSGLKSFWLGHVFFIGMVILFRVRITLRLVPPYLVFVLCLIVANIIRVLVLTLLFAVFKTPELADKIHTPLGIIGFGVSCIFAGWMLRRPYYQDAGHIQRVILRPFSQVVSLAIVTLAIAALAVSPDARDEIKQKQARSITKLPSLFQAKSVSLTSGEKTYFGGSGSTSARKWMVRFNKRPGSLLLVNSQDFNRFHAPEICMVANGIMVDHMETVTLAGGIKVRLMSLNNGRHTGIYWLQSGSLTTDSFTERYWSYIFSGRKSWNMIALIIDEPYSRHPNHMNKTIASLFRALSGEGHADVH